MKVFSQNGLWCLEAEANDRIWLYMKNSGRPVLHTQLHTWLDAAFPGEWTTVFHNKRTLVVSRSLKVIRTFKLRWQDDQEVTYHDAAAYYAPYIPLPCNALQKAS